MIKSLKSTLMILLTLLTAQFLTAQKSQSKAKVAQENKLLNQYSLVLNKEKLIILEKVAKLWFDTSQFTVKIQKNDLANIETESDPFQPIALINRVNGNQGRNEKIVLFDPRTGKIKKILDLKKIGPYTKAKLPLLDEIDEYNAERIGVQRKKDGKADLSLIKRYLTRDWVQIDDDGYVLLTFHKLGLTGSKKAFVPKIKIYSDGMLTSMPGSRIVDSWITCILYNPDGNEIFNTGDLNIPSGGADLSKDRKYLIINFIGAEDMNALGNRWDGDGFLVYDLMTKKEIYKYSLPLDDKERFMGGATYDINENDEPTGLIVANFTLPDTKEGYGEQWVMDMKTRVKYSFRFNGAQYYDLSVNWGTKYKSFKNIIQNNLFEYKIEKF
jgi:hypothetical protein